MKEIKFRYVFKRKLFKDVSFYHLTLKQIEEGAMIKILKSGMIENGYELIGKDRYTGLKDKNKKDIYEKDILLIQDEWTEPITDDGRGPCEPCNHLTPVIFEKGSFGVDIRDNADIYSKGFYDFNNNLDDFGDLEIIGNVYENPELLEKK